MAHDFAKKRPSERGSKRSSKKKSTSSSLSSSSHWSWFFSGLTLGLLCAISTYFVVLKPTALQLPISNMDIIPATPQEIEPETGFGFYELLAESEVQVDVIPVAIVSNTAEEKEDPINYLLQAGSFQLHQDAQNRLAKVILLNMDASIVPGIVSGKTWHRVQVGPFSGRGSAENARDVLSSNNIDTIVLQMR